MRTFKLYARILELYTGECTDALQFLFVKDVFRGILGCDAAFDPVILELDAEVGHAMRINYHDTQEMRLLIVLGDSVQR